MAIITLASVTGAPGVSTTAVALALQNPKPTMLIEADISRTSSILPGTLQGQVQHTTGLTEAAVADQRNDLTAQVLWDQTVELAPDTVLVPGFRTLSGAAGTTPGFWRELIHAATPLETSGWDVIIDLGRLRFNDIRIPLMRESDSVTLLVDGTLPTTAAVFSHTHELDEYGRSVPRGWLLTALGEVGHDSYVDLIYTERPEGQWTYPSQDAPKALGLKLLGKLPWDPKNASPYLWGANGPRNPKKAPYVRSIDALLTAYTDTIGERKLSLEIEQEAAQ
ncbi:hypothetical protein [Microbacterium aurantiacum]|uniref:hypothetical protein n=1 Tax=Microbacterium aurantiacum TaxID=162393 RepID=UPI000C804D4E|nr:hypothetical protein [Microbacterium aurantiacum]